MSGRSDDFEVNGLVIREVKNGESDKIITILTAEHGRITISGKGLSSIRNRHAAAARLFTYSTFQLHRRGDFHYIRDTFYLEGFTSIHYDAEKLALANYICDVAGDLSLDGVGDGELMSLTLNTLYAIANMDAVPLEQIKAAFDQSEKEVTDLHSRISQGIREAKKNGTKIGLSKGTTLTTAKSVKSKDIIKKHATDFGGTLSDKEVIALCRVSRNSYYKYKRELKMPTA